MKIRSKQDNEGIILLIRWALTIALIIFAWRGCFWAIGLLFVCLFIKVEAEYAMRRVGK